MRLELGFNPRARAGRDRRRHVDILDSVEAVSIHAPARGATQPCRAHSPADASCFNPRARAGRDPARPAENATRAMFQSTRPRGARRYRAIEHDAHGARVSIHAPARGATRSMRLMQDAQTLVSIHAPARGATSRSACLCVTGVACFNPRARAGRDISSQTIADVSDGSVSIHAPARGATACESFGLHRRWRVSIHAPARGATTYRDTATICEACFNPRARAGRDAASPPAPTCGRCRFNPRARAGRDLRPADELVSCSTCFNPRARAGRDQGGRTRGPTSRCVFQSTRPRGARLCTS